MSPYRSVTAYAPRLEAPALQPQSFQLADFLRMVSARRKLVFRVALGTVLAAILIALLLPTVYSSSAVVMLDARKNNVTDMSAVLSQLQPDPATLQNQIQILTSRDLAAKVITRLRLYDDPEFNSTLGSPGLLGLFNPKNWFDPEPQRRDIAKTRDMILDSFIKHVSAEANGLSTAITVTATSRDANKSARIANALVQAYMDDQLLRKRDATGQTTAWLNTRIHDLAQQLQAQDEAVQRYKTRNGLADSGPGTSLADQQAGGINAQIIEARSDLATKQATQDRVQQLLQSGNPADVGQVVSSPSIVQLRGQQAELARQEADLNNKYGPLHPKLQAAEAQRHDLDQKISQEVGRITGSISNDVMVAQARLGALQGALVHAEQVSASQNMARTQLQTLESNAASTRTTYEAFVQRLRGAQDQDATLSSESRIISDAPIPLTPSSPKRKLIVAASLPLGLLFGILAALLLERFGYLLPVRVNGAPHASLIPPVSAYPERAARAASPRREAKPEQSGAEWNGPPILGEIANTGSLRAADYVIDWPKSRFAHASAALVRQLESRNGEGSVVALTATEPGDNKSVIAVSLARAAAQMGKKTVIIDCDPARRTATALHSKNSAGLYEVLTGTVPLNQALAKDPRGQAYLLALQQRPPHASNMFASPQMARLLEILRDGCDFVVLDCGPALSGPDAALIARHADATVLVSRREKLYARSMANATQLLQSAKAAPLGLVIAT